MLKKLFLAASAIFSALCTFAEPLHMEQTALHDTQPLSSVKDSVVTSDASSSWSFDQEPPINSTSHLIFNTYRKFVFTNGDRNLLETGHTVVPVTIPTGTLLYHGTSFEKIPTGPEWVATDPEHSYVFCRSVSEKYFGCWHLTLVVTSPLKLLYFDGSSAAKMTGGPMDIQDLITWGKIEPNLITKEKERIDRLCQWGEQYGLDGFLRMTVDFEIMLCSFSAKVEPISFVNILSVDSGLSRKTTTTGLINSVNNATEKPLLLQSLFRVLESGGWYNNFPDARITIDHTRLVSFYDKGLFPSLQEARLNASRLDHNLRTISRADTKMFHKALDKILRSPSKDGLGSGVNWRGQFQVITNAYADRLEILRYILVNVTSNAPVGGPDAHATTTLKQAHRHISSMIAPFVLYKFIPPQIAGDTHTGHGKNLSWAAPVFKLCSRTHVDYVEKKLYSKLTYSEILLLDAIKDVSKEICRILVGLWAEGIDYGLYEPGESVPYLRYNKDAHGKEPLLELAERWRLKAENLMNWLDWSYWLRCRPTCSYEEVCYLPTWPLFYKNDEADPQPRCIRKMESFLFKDTNETN